MDYQVFILVDENGEIVYHPGDDEITAGPMVLYKHEDAKEFNDTLYHGRMRIVEGVDTIRLLGPDEPAVVRG